MARALANECSTGEKKVAFFMRKGADCLSKWVGESERQLRLLFDQVKEFDLIQQQQSCPLMISFPKFFVKPWTVTQSGMC